MRHLGLTRRNLTALAALLLMAAARPAGAQGVAPRLTFVEASTDRARGALAVDGDRRTAWIGVARRKGAWIMFKLAATTRLMGLKVETAPMPASTTYRIEVSVDGEHFATVLDDLRNETDQATIRPFDPPRDATFVRLTFFNGSRQPFIPFSLYEVSALPEPMTPLLPAPTGSVAVGVPTPEPSASPVPAPRLHGAVIGMWEGRRVIVVVGDGFSSPITSVRAENHLLKVLETTPTQILCEYPYGRSPHVTLVLHQGPFRAKRTVAPVHRAIKWLSKPVALPAP